MDADNDGSLYVSGQFSGDLALPGTGSSTASGPGDLYVAKLSNTINTIWMRTMGGTGNEAAFAVKADATGHVYFTGYHFGGPYIYVTADGMSHTLTGNGGADVIIGKLNNDGSILWMRDFGGGSAGNARDLALGTNGKIYVTGDMGGNTDYDPGTGVFMKDAGVGLDAFIECLDTDGNFISATTIGNTVDGVFGKELEADTNGNLYMASYFRGATNLNPFDGGTPVNVVNVNGDDFFLSKFSEQALAASTFSKNTFTLYPNPASGSFTINGDYPANAQLKIYDAQGNVVRQGVLAEINSTSGLATGLYLVEITANGQRETKKLIIK
jgi:hypothetical protein